MDIYPPDDNKCWICATSKSRQNYENYHNSTKCRKNDRHEDGEEYREERFSKASECRKNDRREDGKEYSKELFSGTSERRKNKRREDGVMHLKKQKSFDILHANKPEDGGLSNPYGSYDGAHEDQFSEASKGQKDDRREDVGYRSMFQYPKGKFYEEFYPTSTSHKDNEKPGEDGGFPNLPRTAQKCEAGKEVIYIRSEEETENYENVMKRIDACVDVMERIESHMKENKKAFEPKYVKRNTGKEQRKCYHCREVRHFVANCPKKQDESNGRTGGTKNEDGCGEDSC